MEKTIKPRRRRVADAPAGDRIAVPITDKIFLSEVEASAYIGVSKWTLRKWVKAGLISPVVLPQGVRRNLFRRESVEAFAASLREG